MGLRGPIIGWSDGLITYGTWSSALSTVSPWLNPAIISLLWILSWTPFFTDCMEIVFAQVWSSFWNHDPVESDFWLTSCLYLAAENGKKFLCGQAWSRVTKFKPFLFPYLFALFIKSDYCTIIVPHRSDIPTLVLASMSVFISYEAKRRKVLGGANVRTFSMMMAVALSGGFVSLLSPRIQSIYQMLQIFIAIAYDVRLIQP